MVAKTLPLTEHLRLDNRDRDPFRNVDCVMRFENLGEDFRAVCATLKIAAPVSLPEYNRSRRDHYSRYYDDDLRRLVGKRFADEIEKFGYTFESAAA